MVGLKEEGQSGAGSYQAKAEKRPRSARHGLGDLVGLERHRDTRFARFEKVHEATVNVGGKALSHSTSHP